MKKQIFLLAMLLLPMVAVAETVEIDGIYYELVSKIKEAEVKSNPNKYMGSVVIPDSLTYNGVEYAVTSIGYEAFNYSQITSITIGKNVRKIGYNAFFICTSLVSVHISDIAAWCNISFNDYYSNPLSYAHYLYLNEDEINDLIIPDCVTAIGDYAFYSCRGLVSVKIPNSVTIIGRNAFNDCSSLISVTIPNSVTSIQRGTFYGCSNLTSITIPNSVTSIEDGHQKNTIYGGAFQNCSGLRSVTIGDFVTKIGSYAFKGCSSLTDISIPSNIATIGESCFEGCGLTSVVIPNKVTDIKGGAFSCCSSLNSVTIGNSVMSIGKYAFGGSSELMNVFCLSETVPATSANAFNDSYVEYATLYVPVGSITKYIAEAPWNKFKEVKGLDGTQFEIKKCITPTISFIDGKLVFDCETEDVTFVSEIKNADPQKFYDKEVTLAPQVTTITVYATKADYDNSDVATATIGWRNGTPILEGFSSIKLEGIETNGDVNGDGTVDVADIATIISRMAGK